MAINSVDDFTFWLLIEVIRSFLKSLSFTGESSSKPTTNTGTNQEGGVEQALSLIHI